MNVKIEKILSRPCMYISCIDEVLDAGSLIVNFLIGMTNGLQSADGSITIQISCAGDNFSVCATGNGLTIPPSLPGNLNHVFDFRHANQSIEPHNGSLDIQFLQPLSWFSRFCSIDIRLEGKHYHQLFAYGEAIGDLTQDLHDTSLNSITFNFMVNSDVFSALNLANDRLHAHIQRWENRHNHKIGSELKVQSEFWHLLRLDISPLEINTLANVCFTCRQGFGAVGSVSAGCQVQVLVKPHVRCDSTGRVGLTMPKPDSMIVR